MQNRLIHLPRIVYFCFVTMLFMSCFNSCKATLSTMYDRGNHRRLGFIQFSINAFIGPLGLLVIDKFFQRFMFRFIFFLSSLANVLYLTIGLTIINCYQSENLLCKDNYLYPFTITLTVLLAPLQTIFFCSFNCYINYLASDVNKGIYFGIAYSLFNSSNALGGVYVYVFDQCEVQSAQIYFMLIVTAFLLTFLYWLVKEAELKKDSVHEFIPMNRSKLKLNLKRMKKLVTHTHFRYFVPTLLLIGMLQGFEYVQLQELLAYAGAKDVGISQISKVTLIQGVGQFIGAISTGLLINFATLTLKMIHVLIIFGYAQAFLVIYLHSQTFLQSYLLIYGFAVSALMCVTYSLIAKKFNKHPQVMILIVAIYCYGFGIWTLLIQVVPLPFGVAIIILCTLLNLIFIFQISE